MPEDLGDLIFVAHRIDADRSLWRLIHRRVKEFPWHKIVCPMRDTRILIDHERTDIMVNGLRYSEFIQQYDSASMIFFVEPEEDPFNEDVSQLIVAFENPQAASIWKLTV